MSTFHIIYDDAARTYGTVSASTSDRLLTDNTCLMQAAGMQVHCQDNVPLLASKRPLMGYAYEEGLYERLLTEWEAHTGKTAKRW
jgi:hypothetical protein